MNNNVPNSVIDAVSIEIASYYYSHSRLNSLFMESGAPGDVPEGNCQNKCRCWFQLCNEDPDVDSMRVLGQVIQKFMDLEPDVSPPSIGAGQERIRTSLAKNQLSYQMNGVITSAGVSPASRSLADFFKARDFSSIEAEFERAISYVDSDPHAAITAASSIIEALCKTFIEMHGLDIPSKQTIVPLWKVVQEHLGLNIDRTLEDDQRRILGGLGAIIDGVGAYRTHIGSVHGRGIEPPSIVPAEARLAVNASHTITAFLMERCFSLVGQSIYAIKR